MKNRRRNVDIVLKGVEFLTKDSKDNKWGFKVVSKPSETYAIVTMGGTTWRVTPSGESWLAEMC
jgi:hypothetical protein